MVKQRSFLVWCTKGSVWLGESSFSSQFDYPFTSPNRQGVRWNKDNDPDIANKDDYEFVIRFIKRGERKSDEEWLTACDDVGECPGAEP